MTTQENREVVSPMNPNMGTVATRIRYFTRINPPEFHGSKVDEDPQEFIDEVVLKFGSNNGRKRGLINAGPLNWEKSTGEFLDCFFPFVMREENVLEFINLRKGNMSVKVYSLKFTQLDKYAPTMVADSWEKMSSSNIPTHNFSNENVSNPKLQGSGGNGSSTRTYQRCGLDLSIEEEHITIMDRQVQKLRTKEIASMKARWKHYSVGEATWEIESDMHASYPQLFVASDTLFCFMFEDEYGF
ncbi:hypothetical protein MTR67_035687 [Solanum verrucosum]|uniref:Retrotransposon gag domain-containing protein n=1 Tax=Solanum verrucosum TaxID=315347 RepID=A0AAF0ZKI7_SOLVR|nr:hypothetical protein MTR67_035687 [Solanum verrucosum]